MEPPESDGDATPCLYDNTNCGPLGLQVVQISYFGGRSEYCVQFAFCRSEKTACPEGGAGGAGGCGGAFPPQTFTCKGLVAEFPFVSTALTTTECAPELKFKSVFTAFEAEVKTLWLSTLMDIFEMPLGEDDDATNCTVGSTFELLTGAVTWMVGAFAGDAVVLLGKL